MPDVVVISGHPRPGSRTFALASAIGEIAAGRRGVAPVVTAGIPPQADVSEALLARLLSELGADVVDFGLTATE
jgi:NAD(P)H-dependent FMN reductase